MKMGAVVRRGVTRSSLAGELVCEAIAALRAACDSDNRVDGDVVSRIVCDEATVDELPTTLMLPQPGYPVDSCYQNLQPPEDALAAVHPLFIEAPQIFHAPDESLRPQLGHRDSARVPSAEEAHWHLPAEDTVDTVVSDASELGHVPDESPWQATSVPWFLGPAAYTQGSHFESQSDDIAYHVANEEQKRDQAFDDATPLPQASNEFTPPSVDGPA